MKRSCLAMFLPVGCVLLAGCSPSFYPFSSSQGEPVSAQTVSPQENLRVARQYAWEAAVLVQNPPHLDERWQEARLKWRQAIRLLEAIPTSTPISKQVQQKLSDYRAKYAAITNRLTNEETAVNHFEQAQAFAWQAAVMVQNPPHARSVWQRAAERWIEAIRLLEAIPPLTTVSGRAQEKLVTYRQNYQVINQRLQAEKTILSTLEKFSATVAQLNALQTKALTGQTEDPIGIEYADYRAMVRSLQTLLQELESLPVAKDHSAYTDMKAAISDYEFALMIWQAYLRHRAANADWLQNGDFFNRLVPLSLIDGDRLLQQYEVKIYQGVSEAKVPLKSTIWRIWEKADQRARVAEKMAADFK
ncbi:MAG: hypothetical protein NW220_17080 [Leptolyngbyaceae cyanobacterium bins.349]|nr:hypothetical protein [Leptolyngbyaceae cyanobacterium bins.349]